MILRFKLETKYEEVMFQEADEDGVLRNVPKIVFIEEIDLKNGDILE